MHVVEETRGSVPGTGPAAFRKRRTVLAPAVSGLEVELEDLQEHGKVQTLDWDEYWERLNP